jgi:hypothetical protein
MGKEGGKSPITLAVTSGNGNTLKKNDGEKKKKKTSITGVPTTAIFPNSLISQCRMYYRTV